MFKAIPVGWSRVPLSSLGERVRRRNTTDNTNVLTISAVHGLVNQKTFFNKIVASANLSNYFLLKRGEFAYNKSYSNGYPVGVVRRLDKYDSGVLSPLYICFDMSSDKVDQDYAVHFFDSQWFIYEVNDIAKEGARNHGLLNVGVGDFFDLSFVLPPLPEQQKIATILSSVDDVIEKTRAQIDKLKDLKTGMMQELLTKGIGHTEFKDSELGDIPLTWDVKLLGEVYPKIVVGYVGNVNDFYCEKDNGVPFYRTLNIRDGFIRNDPVKYVTKEFNEKNKKSQIFNDDILIARVGANLGMTCKVTGLEGSANIANAIIIKSVKNASSDFFMEYIRSDYGQKQIMSEAAGGAQGVFNTSLAQGLVVPVPPLSEQIEIGRKLISFDKYIKLSETKMSCFLALKKALMQDLLTGKVRVKLTDKESAAS